MLRSGSIVGCTHRENPSRPLAFSNGLNGKQIARAVIVGAESRRFIVGSEDLEVGAGGWGQGSEEWGGGWQRFCSSCISASS